MVISHRRHRVRPSPQRHTSYRSGGGGSNLESNSPTGEKIRGSANAIAEKYRQMARDVSSSDFSLAQNYYQHAEHYFRLTSGNTDQNHRPLVNTDQNYRSSGNTDQSYRSSGNTDQGYRYAPTNRRNNANIARGTDTSAKHDAPQPDIISENNGVGPEPHDMQSVLPPTIPQNENRYQKARPQYARRRRRFQTSDTESSDTSS